MNNFIDFQHKQFLVTGATSGIGLATTKTILDYGGKVIIVGRNEESLQRIQHEFGEEKVQFISYDLENLENINLLIEKINSPIDGIVHSAGIVQLLPIKFFDLKLMNKIRTINYDSIILIISKLLKAKKINQSASLVLISSIAANNGMKGNLIYSSTKAALNSSVQVLASELSNSKIRVNTVAPGQVESSMTSKVEEMVSVEAIEIDRKKYPLGYGTPEDVANLCVFLLSDKSKWITGSTITIDGGRSNVLN
jgi:NAD(P)-dependent dehydrogenase (short-subunit alcohol dehydrogenase family)